MAGDLFDNWFDPLEAEVRARSREFIEELRFCQANIRDHLIWSALCHSAALV